MRNFIDLIADYSCHYYLLINSLTVVHESMHYRNFPSITEYLVLTIIIFIIIMNYIKAFSS